MKILAAMSGGVDSSVAAAMLVRDGHDVTGVHLRLTEQTPAMDGRVHGCCGVADADDARRVAQVLDIPFYVWNLKDAFAHGVVEDFVGEYARGRTPNPCVRCNETVKFGALRERARALGFDALATGHYARATHEADGWHLYRGGDQKKDQSYVLARLGQEELARARFPVGAQSKDETRALAHELGLRTADKPDSYEICFVPDGNAGAFVERELGPIPAGEIVGTDGAVLGEHAGIHRFTVGQRRGLGINSGSARTFVLEIDAPANRIVVGPGELLARTGLEAEACRWVAGVAPERIEAVQVRAHGGVYPAGLLDVDGDRARVLFAEPQRGIAPGQLVAFYLGDEVLGGGTIARATR
ncbi:MAG: tRNA 2-thiouridine(34) synthase MnmA [Actinobacteria bacterium]|nr:MAG: tRNA 2-thiouridine(34) synthase MnmA [Actinomycetota bacterium]